MGRGKPHPNPNPNPIHHKKKIPYGTKNYVTYELYNSLSIHSSDYSFEGPSSFHIDRSTLFVLIETGSKEKPFVGLSTMYIYILGCVLLLHK